MTLLKKLAYTTTLFVGVLAASSCYYDVESELYGSTTTCDTTSTVTYSGTIKPLLDATCTSCHNASSPSGGINIDGHTSLKNYITNAKDFFIGSIKHTSGYSAMPKGSTKWSDCNIAKMEKWINAGMLNN